MQHSICWTAACGLLVLAPLAAQTRPVAITNARVLTMAGEAIPRGTVLLRDGVIEAVGADVELPAGAAVVDARGGTLMPGWVSAFSRAGLSSAPQRREEPQARRRGRFRGGSRRPPSGPNASNDAAKKVADELYARQDVFGELLRCGVTTLALAPRGAGFPGRGAILDPAAKTAAAMARDDAAFVLVAPATGTSNKKVVSEALAAAKKVVEERRKPKPQPPAEDAAGAAKGAKDGEPGKGGEQPPVQEPPKDQPPKEEPPKEEPPKEEPPKDEPKRDQPGDGAGQTGERGRRGRGERREPPPPDPDVEVLADLLMGKARALLEVPTANQLLHFLATAGEVRFPKAAFVAVRGSPVEGRLDEVADRLVPWQAPVLIEPELTTEAVGRWVVNPAARLAAAGLQVGFVLGDSKRELRELLYNLMELVRHGLDRDVALAGITRVPALALGLEERVGSIAAGRDADLLLFSGDPLDPTARLLRIWHKGEALDAEPLQ